MVGIDQQAPSGTDVVDYDRRHLALYAALIDADDAGTPWQEAASLLRLDPADIDTEACWRSHLERARWIVGEGLATAVLAFGREGKTS